MRTLRDLAAQAGVSHEAVRKAVKSGRLIAVRDESTGLNQLLVSDEEADRWLASRATKSPSRRPARAAGPASKTPRTAAPPQVHTGATIEPAEGSWTAHEEVTAALATTDWASVIAELGLTSQDLARAVVDVVADQQRRHVS